MVIVRDNELSFAIGKEGQDARLAAQLTGWRIDIEGGNETRPKKRPRVRDQSELQGRFSSRTNRPKWSRTRQGTRPLWRRSETTTPNLVAGFGGEERRQRAEADQVRVVQGCSSDTRQQSVRPQQTATTHASSRKDAEASGNNTDLRRLQTAQPTNVSFRVGREQADSQLRSTTKALAGVHRSAGVRWHKF